MRTNSHGLFEIEDDVDVAEMLTQMFIHPGANMRISTFRSSRRHDKLAVGVTITPKDGTAAQYIISPAGARDAAGQVEAVANEIANEEVLIERAGGAAAVDLPLRMFRMTVDSLRQAADMADGLVKATLQ